VDVGGREQDEELVAADTRREVARPQGLAQQLAEASQQPVAGRVAKAVVDAFEVVAVDQQRRERSARASALTVLSLQRAFEPPAVP
jgi:hypothetical protein